MSAHSSTWNIHSPPPPNPQFTCSYKRHKLTEKAFPPVWSSLWGQVMFLLCLQFQPCLAAGSSYDENWRQQNPQKLQRHTMKTEENRSTKQKCLEQTNWGLTSVQMSSQTIKGMHTWRHCGLSKYGFCHVMYSRKCMKSQVAPSIIFNIFKFCFICSWYIIWCFFMINACRIFF